MTETERQGIAFVPYFPLGAAWTIDNVLDDPIVKEIAAAHDDTPAHIALAWLLSHASNILLIPGTSSVDHLEENLAAGDVELTADEIARLDSVGAASAQ